MAQRSAKYWSADVTEHSDALSLEDHVFAKSDPHAIALSLKASAEKSNRRKASPFQSAMSMLNFFINRGGSQLSAARKRTLEKAKDELRKVFGREEVDSTRAARKSTGKRSSTAKTATAKKRAGAKGESRRAAGSSTRKKAPTKSTAHTRAAARKTTGRKHSTKSKGASQSKAS
jgi:hypothetical protein